PRRVRYVERRDERSGGHPQTADELLVVLGLMTRAGRAGDRARQEARAGVGGKSPPLRNARAPHEICTGDGVPEQPRRVISRQRRCIQSQSSGCRRTYVSSTFVHRCVNSRIASGVSAHGGGTGRSYTSRYRPRGSGSANTGITAAPVRNAREASAVVVAAGRP